MFESLQRWLVRIFRGNDRSVDMAHYAEKLRLPQNSPQSSPEGEMIQCSAIAPDLTVQPANAVITKVIIWLPPGEESGALSQQDEAEKLETSFREWLSGDRCVLILPPAAEIEFFDIKQ